ncbi:hypothetical protein GUITHDRAFT_118321 [Guillardia theta CCMP2712]|uniref:Uncharacterized protein n=2 Tax=Guillardia theta TaxID=55529 RepID=L1II64_GUITC|nr:hypothetical protein GUITHDRAFT_118321 [Guillardia theta CCMP2712]EKX35510.1 hypothetical protein GUITHDRAFT_118321 [Guillardia theta CCMP2712]|mmetsp:Transcript_27219/g.88948  ORF Transcript_27219/g.88948 Transcript_27219/m.88948 type:complete len:108 (+) Transcript_27219:858-1181(+)|eukprot:XP_005822490.1 hypothetical protein GUITHDRAFT_118321 [Guillardia theta CCMP2712]
MPQNPKSRINLKDLEVYVGVGCSELRQIVLYETPGYTKDQALVFFQHIKNSLMDFDSLSKGMSEFHDAKIFLEMIKISCQNTLMVLQSKEEWDSLQEIIETIDILLS